MQRTGSIAPFIAMLTGPIVWAAHFSSLYAAATLACLTPETSESAPRIFAGALTLILIGGLARFVARRIQAARHADKSHGHFIDAVAGLLAALSILAMLWTALSMAMIADCRV